MDENTTKLTAAECYRESANALRDKNTDVALHWRLLGDSIVTSNRG
jgi:hypothetical protein